MIDECLGGWMDDKATIGRDFFLSIYIYKDKW